MPIQATVESCGETALYDTLPLDFCAVSQVEEEPMAVSKNKKENGGDNSCPSYQQIYCATSPSSRQLRSEGANIPIRSVSCPCIFQTRSLAHDFKPDSAYQE